MSAPQDAGSGVRPARLGQSRRQLRCAEALASAASPAAEVLIDCPSTGGILAAQRRGRSFLTPFPLFKNDTASRWGDGIVLCFLRYFDTMHHFFRRRTIVNEQGYR